ncbi:MAG: condensation domain-containing protein, partial [Ignavibacteriales bacterium]
MIITLDLLPLTPNGKLDRRALPDANIAENDREKTEPRTEKEKKLADIWRDVLNVDNISVRDNFFEIGGDSILAIQVVAKARKAGFDIEPVHIFQHQTIEQLSLIISEIKERNNGEEAESDNSALLPVQRAFFEWNLPQRNHWNQSVFFEIKEPVEPEMIRKIVRIIMDYHEILRASFRLNNNEWEMQFNKLNDNLPFEIIDLSEIENSHLSTEIEIRAFEIQSSLDIEKGPVIKFAYFCCNEGNNNKLLIAAHHLIIDVVSWRILLEDILTVFRQIEQQSPIVLPQKSTSYKKWVEIINEYSKSEELKRESDYWLRLPYDKWVPIEKDFEGNENIEKDIVSVSSVLNTGDTLALIREAQKKSNANIMEILLTALARAYSRWTDKRVLKIDLEGHGRESLKEKSDLTRTIGWFTNIYPVFLDLASSVYPMDSLKEIKEQLRSVPNHGMGFGIFKYLYKDQFIKEKFNSIPKSEISFNYLGQLNQFTRDDNQLFMPAEYSKGPERGPLNPVPYIINIICLVSGDNFQVHMSFSSKLFKESNIQKFSNLFIEELRILIDKCMTSNNDYTASDFPMANLNRDKFNKVLNRLNQKTVKAKYE